jgi:hypothetical protein
VDNPFECDGTWYRANLHAHTTESDGDLPPEEAAKFYRRAGYDVLAITDHDRVTHIEAEIPGLLLVSGVELGAGRSKQGTRFHIVGLDVRSSGPWTHRAESAQEAVNALREDGGIAFIAHPYWSGLMADDMAGVTGAFAIEVYNTGCDLEILRGFSMIQWDDLLTLGCTYGALAVDDGHRGAVDHGLGWTMIRAKELSAATIREALLRGRYYASTGPEIVNVAADGGKVTVETSPVSSIALVSEPEKGARARAKPGDSIRGAEFELPDARYCRVEAMDREGKIAWSNPLLLRNAAASPSP